MNKDNEHQIEDEPTLNLSVAKELDRLGTSELPSLRRLVPVMDTEQTGVAGERGNISKSYVGHICYSPDFDCLVYQVEKERNHILHSVDGRGIAISEDTITLLINDYDVEFVFAGIRESDNLLIIPVDEFKYEWHTSDYDKQLYARLDEGVKYQIPNCMSEVMSKIPSKSDRCIKKQDALDT